MRMDYRRCIPYPQCRSGEEFHLYNWGFRGPPIHYLKIHATWAPTQNVCEVLYTSTKTFTSTIVTMLGADVVLLLTMLVGLIRLRQDGTMFGLVKFLWNQGLKWLFLSTVAGLTPAIFIGLNLNCKVYFICRPATENNEPEPVGETRSFQHHVSNARTYRDVNRHDVDASLFDRLR